MTRYYKDSPIKENVLQIVNDIILTNKSIGWVGEIKEVEELKTELIKYNIIYTHDWLGQWELKSH